MIVKKLFRIEGRIKKSVIVSYFKALCIASDIFEVVDILKNKYQESIYPDVIESLCQIETGNSKLLKFVLPNDSEFGTIFEQLPNNGSRIVCKVSGIAPNDKKFIAISYINDLSDIIKLFNDYKIHSIQNTNFSIDEETTRIAELYFDGDEKYDEINNTSNIFVASGKDTYGQDINIIFNNKENIKLIQEKYTINSINDFKLSNNKYIKIKYWRKEKWKRSTTMSNG